MQVREIRVVKPEVTGEEISRIMQEEDPSRIFQQEMLGDFDNQRARQNLLFITERHKDILRLEKSIRELHQVRGKACGGHVLTGGAHSCLWTWRRWCHRRASSSTRSSTPVRRLPGGVAWMTDAWLQCRRVWNTRFRPTESWRAPSRRPAVGAAR